MSRDQEADVVLGELRRKVSLVRSGLEDVERRLEQKAVSTSLLLAAARGLSGDVMQVLELAGEYKGLTGGTKDIDAKDTALPKGPVDDVFVIGFEGGAADEDVVTYGAAAFLVSGRVINAVSGATCDVEQWQRLVADGMATALRHPWRVAASDAKQPCYVLRAVGGSGVPRYVAQAKGPRALRSWHDVGDAFYFYYWLFADLGSLEARAAEAATWLRGSTDPVCLAAARVLDPYDGMGKEEYLRRLRVGRTASSFLGPSPDPDTLQPVTSYRRP